MTFLLTVWLLIYFMTNPNDMTGSLKMNTALEYSTRVVQEGDRRCKKSTLNDLAYLTPLRIPLMNPVIFSKQVSFTITLNKMSVNLAFRFFYLQFNFAYPIWPGPRTVTVILI